MDFESLSLSFNRALAFTFSKKKLLAVFCILVMSGLLVVFFRGIALHAGQWVQLSLTFLPIFICAGILLSLGILLIRLYHNEIKQKEDRFWKTLSESWEVIIGSSYFSIPIILSYLLLWILLGIFVLLSEIPAVGTFFSAILAFAPFLINLGTLVLCVISVISLFCIAPLIALKSLDTRVIFHNVVEKLEKESFATMILFLIALIPLAFVVFLLFIAASLTGTVCLECRHSVQNVVKWFFIMVPFTAFLTPAIIFFFNFAAEAHMLTQRRLRKKEK